MNAEIVKPFRLSEGNYIVTNRGELHGPLVRSKNNPDEFCTIQSPVRWNVSGVPVAENLHGDRIADLITGPTGMVNFIERMSFYARDAQPEKGFARNQIHHAREALMDMVKNEKAAKAEVNPAPAPIGDLSNSLVHNLLREIIREELRAVIHEEMPAIVADATNFFDAGELRLAMTLRPMDVAR